MSPFFPYLADANKRVTEAMHTSNGARAGRDVGFEGPRTTRGSEVLRVEFQSDRGSNLHKKGSYGREGGRLSDAILFDRHKVQHLEALTDRPRRLSGSKLLWVDLHRGTEISAQDVGEAFELDDQTRN
jgi:hypothetical protein